jgi:hypothetical protein
MKASPKDLLKIQTVLASIEVSRPVPESWTQTDAELAITPGGTQLMAVTTPGWATMKKVDFSDEEDRKLYEHTIMYFYMQVT